MAYFPFFVDIKNKDCLVVGSGSVALRKIEQLLSFEACVTCISPGNIEIDAVNFINREFKDSDLDNRFIVIACSDNHSLNKHIGRLCREKGIAVNVVDDKEECNFIFPSIIKNGDITAAFSSNGNNPVICKYLKERNQKIISDRLAECNEILKEKRKELMDIPYSRRSEILMELLKEYMGDRDED